MDKKKTSCNNIPAIGETTDDKKHQKTLSNNENIATARNENKTPSKSKIRGSLAVHFWREAARQQQVQKCVRPRRSAARTTKAATGKEARRGAEEARRGLPVTVETNLSPAVVTYFERHLAKTVQRHSVSPAPQKEQ